MAGGKHDGRTAWLVVTSDHLPYQPPGADPPPGELGYNANC